MDIIQMSLSASILITAIMVIRALTLHKLPKKTFLVLWGVATFRLLLPFSIPSRFSIYTGLTMLKGLFVKKDSILLSIEAITIPKTESLVDIGEFIPNPTPISTIEIIWTAGMWVCILFFITSYITCIRKFKTSLPVSNGFIARWMHENPLRRPVQIRQSDLISAPLTYGIFRPVVLLPKNADWNNETLKYVLSHEYTHIRHFDALTKLVLTAALCIHWFNPLVWMMYLLANRDIELFCDETVVRSLGINTKSNYALTLIGLEEKKGGITPLVSNFSKNTIEERIVSIMKIRKTSLLGTALALVLVAGTTAVFATNIAAADKDENQSYEKSAAINAYIMDENGSKLPVDGQVNQTDSFTINEDGTVTPSTSYDKTFITIYKFDANGDSLDFSSLHSQGEEMNAAHPRTYTDEELARIIEDIEAGRIEPLSKTTLPEGVSVDVLADGTLSFIDSDGNKVDIILDK